MDRFNTPWRVTSAAIYTTPTDSRVYGTLDIDVTEAKNFLDRKREEGVKLTMVHLTTAVLARAIGFDVPEMNCFIRRGAVVGREHMDVMVPVQVGGEAGVTPVIIRNAHARKVTDIAEDIRAKAARSRGGDEIKAAKNKYVLNRIPWPFRRPVFLLLKWITVDMGIEIKALGLSAHSFGSFVVSDIGSFGLNTGMTALMPAAKVPCVVVLGKIEEKPVVKNGEIVIRTILPLTGTFDHRIVDGMQIGKLARALKRNFRKPEWLDEVPEKELEECIFAVR
ncbi:MAG: dehydrogenase [Gammaproteobacteria bacterium]|jgi:pyruvate dehydrogenase E2 component (dihydrolipoamide acetyltransferase)|nr:dehydrogenase [Gammaproteobacteria bacterium]